VGLTTATEIYLKQTVVVPVRPGSGVLLALAATDGTVSWYARVRSRVADPIEAAVAAYLRRTGPATGCFAITKSDATVFPCATKGIFVGTGGNVAVVLDDGQAVTITGVLSGTILDVAARQVMSANTTASNMTGLT
jgi:hypothetical protein